jgi:hypothetical protein
MEKFFTSGDADDPVYLKWRDHAGYDRERVERLWTRYKPYCPDRNFLTEARKHFIQRTWEMHLACVLMDHGAALRRAAPTGPDIRIDSDPPIWIEAIAVTAGEKIDRVRSREERRYKESPAHPMAWAGYLPSENGMILRFTSALSEKRRKFAGYRQLGIVGENDVCIVAISFAAIDDAFYLIDYPPIPIFIKALFEIGPDMLLLAKEDDTPPKWFQPPRPRITKNSGSPVDANAFVAGTAEEISGVFATASDLEKSPDSGEKIMFVNNPTARNPVSAGTFRFGLEFIAADEKVDRRDWSRLTCR